MTYLIVITTFKNKKSAESLARKIVEKKLGACIQISEIKSLYNWKGKFETPNEFKLEIKTSEDMYEKVEKFIIENHEYELPEIVTIKIDKGNKKYLGWVKENLKCQSQN